MRRKFNYILIVSFLNYETTERNKCTHPSFIKVMLPSFEFGSALFDDQQWTGKRSRLGAALLVSTIALKYKVLSRGTGSGTSPVKSEL